MELIHRVHHIWWASLESSYTTQSSNILVIIIIKLNLNELGTIFILNYDLLTTNYSS